MAEFATVNPDTLNEYFMRTLGLLGKRKQDIVDVPHPIIQKMKQNGGNVTESRGRGPVRDVQIKTPDHGTELSETQDMIGLNIGLDDNDTQAQYEWGMFLETVSLGKFRMTNTKGLEGLTSYLVRKINQVTPRLRIKLKDILWNGRVIGTNKIFGIADIIRTVPTTESGKGAVGGLSVTDHPTWVPRANAYNAAFVEVSSGGYRENSFLTSEDGAYEVYYDCMQNADSEPPNIWAVNKVMMSQLQRLADAKEIFRDEYEERQMGQKAFRFNAAMAYQDDDMPADPLDPTGTKGFGRFINTEDLQLVYAAGLEGGWEEGYSLPTITGWIKNYQMQCSIAVGDVRRHGSISGVQDMA